MPPLISKETLDVLGKLRKKNESQTFRIIGTCNLGPFVWHIYEEK